MYRLFLGKISTLSTRPLPHKLAAQAPQGSRRASWLAGRFLLAQAVSPLPVRTLQRGYFYKEAA